MVFFGKWHLMFFKVRTVPIIQIRSEYFLSWDNPTSEIQAEERNKIFEQAYKLALLDGGIKPKYLPKGKRS